jgi:hypothetical protein
MRKMEQGRNAMSSTPTRVRCEETSTRRGRCFTLRPVDDSGRRRSGAFYFLLGFVFLAVSIGAVVTAVAASHVGDVILNLGFAAFTTFFAGLLTLLGVGDVIDLVECTVSARGIEVRRRGDPTSREAWTRPLSFAVAFRAEEGAVRLVTHDGGALALR